MKLFFEIIVILTISAILGYISSDLFDFLKGTLLYSIVIITSLYFYTTKLEKKAADNIESIDTVIDEFIKNQSITIPCPCQKYNHVVFLQPNEDMILKCDECSSEYSLDVQYTPILITTPLQPEVVYDRLLKEQEYNNKNE